MKIVLDLTKLVAEGKLTAAQAEELQALAKPGTSLLAINILMAFGVFAIAGGLLALVPSLITAIALGAVLAGAGVAISLGVSAQWSLLGTSITIAGALITSAGIIGPSDGRWFGFAIAAALLLGLAIAIRSALLSALTALALAGLLGSSTEYDSATYYLIVQEPTITIVTFSLLALAGYLVSLRVAPVYEPLAISFSRLSLLMVNFGFWIGSLWGDDPGHSWRSDYTPHPYIPDLVFVVGWAAALVGVGIWAARANRRFVVNTVAAFGAIHFYTQWFERLGAAPLTIALAGVLVVAVAVVLWRYNTPARRAPAAA
jgi:iron complex transport system permease protein